MYSSLYRQILTYFPNRLVYNKFQTIYCSIPAPLSPDSSVIPRVGIPPPKTLSVLCHLCIKRKENAHIAASYLGHYKFMFCLTRCGIK